MKCSRCGAALAKGAAACEACGSIVPKLEGEALPPGTTFAGKYVVGEEIGAGGMGRIYRAVQQPLATEVCIKTLHKGATADPQFEARFLREAKTTAGLRHPNIVTVLDFGMHVDGSLYLVMEYIEGKSLAALAKEGGVMSAARAVRILGQVCDALSAAHDKGVIHRDLKPANIMVLDLVDQKDFVKVLDFGSALILEGAEQESERLTRAGTVIGTPAYMAPEHILGRGIDGRVDIYAVGVLFYMLLCGSAPFRGKVQAVFAQQVSVLPDPPSKRNPKADVTPQVEGVIMRALAKDPARRYPTAVALKTAMEAALAGIGEETYEVEDIQKGIAIAAAPEERSVVLVAVRGVGLEREEVARSIAESGRSFGAVAEVGERGLRLVFGLDRQGPEAARQAMDCALELAGRQTRSPLSLALHDALASCRGSAGEAGFDYEVFGEGAESVEALAAGATPGQVLVSGPVARLVPSELRLTPVLPPAEIHAPVFALVDPVTGEAGQKQLPFVGRAKETRALVEVAVEATAGKVCVIVGGEGMGKTRLVREVASQAGRLDTLWCVVPASAQAEVGPAHPVSLVAALGWSTADPAASTTERYVVGLMLGRQDRTHDGLSGDRRQLRLVSAAIEGLVRRTEHGPVVLAFDELHRADDLTWALAKRLAHTASVLHVSVVLCVRAFEDIPFSLPEDILRVDLGPLSDAEVQSLTMSVLGAEADAMTVELVASRAQGLPLLAAEVLETVGRGAGSLLATLGDGDPLEAVQRLVSTRIEKVSERALEMLCAAAVLGAEPPEAEVLDLVGESEGNDLALLELHSEDLLHTDPAGRLRFPFPRVRAAALASVPRKSLRALRAEAARVIKRRDESESRRFEVGRHLLAAGDYAGAFTELRRAGTLSRAEGETARALACFRACYETSKRLGADRIEDRSGVARDLAELLIERGLLDEAWELLSRALDEARTALREAAAGELVAIGADMLRLHGRIALLTGDTARARSEIATAVGFAEGQELAVAAADACADLAEVAEKQGDLQAEADALLHGLALIDGAPAADSRQVRIRLFNRLGQVELQKGDVKKAIALFGQALDVAETAGDQFQGAALLGNLGGAYARLQDVARAVHYTERALRASEALGDQIGVSRQSFNLALLRLSSGQGPAAHKLLRAAHEAARRCGWKEGLDMSGAAMKKLGIAS